jgi:hypothetical protein
MHWLDQMRPQLPCARPKLAALTLSPRPPCRLALNPADDEAFLRVLNVPPRRLGEKLQVGPVVCDCLAGDGLFAKAV